MDAIAKPPPREVKIQSNVKNSLKIDFDIDIGLLMHAVPNRDQIEGMVGL